MGFCTPTRNKSGGGKQTEQVGNYDWKCSKMPIIPQNSKKANFSQCFCPEMGFFFLSLQPFSRQTQLHVIYGTGYADRRFAY